MKGPSFQAIEWKKQEKALSYYGVAADAKFLVQQAHRLRQILR